VRQPENRANQNEDDRRSCHRYPACQGSTPHDRI
jgi:hypothetical protein